jgi:DNA-directed RNA polymerase specialized sigma24 family protein
MTQPDYNREVLKKLDILVKLTAANIVQQNKNFKEQVRLLSAVGMQPKEIAELLNKTPNNVSVTLSAIRKESRRQDAEEGDTNAGPGNEQASH